MDLGYCPRCGDKWTTGNEMCPNCGFIPIGAGLRTLSRLARAEDAAKKKSTKTKKSRLDDFDFSLIRGYEVANAAGFFLSVCIFLIVAFSYNGKPWRNDFQSIRELLGDKPARSMTGHWIIEEDRPFGSTVNYLDELGGSFSFSDEGNVHLQWERKRKNIDVDARYVVVGETLSISGFSSKGDPSLGLPGQITFDLNWLGQDRVEASIGDKEVLVLSRESMQP